MAVAENSAADLSTSVWYVAAAIVIHNIPGGPGDRGVPDSGRYNDLPSPVVEHFFQLAATMDGDWGLSVRHPIPPIW